MTIVQKTVSILIHLKIERTIKKQSVIKLQFDDLKISRLHNVPTVFVI